MRKEQLAQFIKDKYSANSEHLWAKNPDYAVFRHMDNKKWFAVLMDVPKSKLDGSSGDKVDILNLKCDPILIGSLRNEKGIYPAYHMSKEHWITLLLEDDLDDDRVKWLLDLSFELTKTKKKIK